MRILIGGASGMIGSALAPWLRDQGHEVVRLVRKEPGAAEIAWDPDRGVIDARKLEDFDGVVQLASMPWTGRWNADFKKKMLDNRLATNRLLAETIAGCKNKPRVLVCASGMGIYVPAGDEFITEDSATGTDFLAELQCAGEAATGAANRAGIRVVNLRIPAVMGGAALASLAEMTRRGISHMGSGRQWSSWVARDELCSIIQHVLITETVRGPVNPVSPNPVRSAEVPEVLGRILGCHARMPIPAFLLRAALGEVADALILASRRIMPSKLLASGYQFCFPELEEALRHELAAAA